MRRRGALASLGAVACTSLLLAGAVPAPVPAVCLVGILAAVRARALPETLLLVLQGALVLPLAYLAMVREVDFLSVLLTAGAPLLFLRVFFRESEFNDFLVLLVSLLVAVGSAAVAPGLMPLLISALYVLVASHALAVLAVRRDGGAADVRIRLDRAPGWWRAAPALATHHLAVAGLLLGSLFYLVAPRPERPEPRPFGEQLHAAGERRTGSRSAVARADFPREVRIGDLARMKRRLSPALDVEIRLRGRPFDPGAAERTLLLLRARAWEDYVPADGRWEPPRASPQPLPASGVLEPGDAELDWSFDVVGYDGRTLFVPQRLKSVRAAGGSLAIDRLGVVTSAVPVFQYRAASARRADPDALAPDLTNRRLLLVPDAAAAVLFPHLPAAPRGDVALTAGAIADYFRVNGFRYTLELPPGLAEAKDPLREFLERREGNCELYATAACLFLRMMGVPARIAGGVRCAERLGPGKYRARFSNAHAWVEVPCRGVGFVPLDFTPPDSAAAPVSPDAGGGSEAEAGGPGGGEEASIDWRDPFAYGPEEQERVMAWLGDRLFSWPLLVLAGLLLAWLVVPALAGAAARARSPFRVTAPEGQRAGTLAFYARWLKRCAAEGHPRARHQTPREFLRGLPAELAAEGAGITAEFERLRYGAA
jgi:transglutaminase-like putative cysteine protease